MVLLFHFHFLTINTKSINTKGKYIISNNNIYHSENVKVNDDEDGDDDEEGDEDEENSNQSY